MTNGLTRLTHQPAAGRLRVKRLALNGECTCRLSRCKENPRMRFRRGKVMSTRIAYSNWCCRWIERTKWNKCAVDALLAVAHFRYRSPLLHLFINWIFDSQRERGCLVCRLLPKRVRIRRIRPWQKRGNRAMKRGKTDNFANEWMLHLHRWRLSAVRVSIRAVGSDDCVDFARQQQTNTAKLVKQKERKSAVGSPISHQLAIAESPGGGSRRSIVSSMRNFYVTSSHLILEDRPWIRDSFHSRSIGQRVT